MGFALIRPTYFLHLFKFCINEWLTVCNLAYKLYFFNVLTRLCFVYSAYMFISDDVTRKGANLSEKLTCVYVINKHQMHIYYVIKPIVDEKISPQCKHVMSCLA